MNPLLTILLSCSVPGGFPELAGALLQARDWSRLQVLAEARVREDPKDRLGWRMLGLCEAARRDREATLRCARRLLTLRPGDAAASLKDPAVAEVLLPQASFEILDPSRISVKSRPPVPLAPALLREEGGAVLLEVVLDGDGLPLRALALNASPVLRAAAEAYAVQWVLEPLPDRRPRFTSESSSVVSWCSSSKGGSMDLGFAMPPAGAGPDELRSWAHELFGGLASCTSQLRWSAIPTLAGSVELRLLGLEGELAHGELSGRIWPWMISHIKKVARLDAGEHFERQLGIIEPAGFSGRIWVETSRWPAQGSWRAEQLFIWNDAAERDREAGGIPPGAP